jgi:hypothetical protein
MPATNYYYGGESQKGIDHIRDGGVFEVYAFDNKEERDRWLRDDSKHRKIITIETARTRKLVNVARDGNIDEIYYIESWLEMVGGIKAASIAREVMSLRLRAIDLDKTGYRQFESPTEREEFFRLKKREKELEETLWLRGLGQYELKWDQRDLRAESEREAKLELHSYLGDFYGAFDDRELDLLIAALESEEFREITQMGYKYLQMHANRFAESVCKSGDKARILEFIRDGLSEQKAAEA